MDGVEERAVLSVPLSTGSGVGRLEGMGGGAAVEAGAGVEVGMEGLQYVYRKLRGVVGSGEVCVFDGGGVRFSGRSCVREREAKPLSLSVSLTSSLRSSSASSPRPSDAKLRPSVERVE